MTIKDIFDKFKTPKEAYVFLYLLAHADDNGVVNRMSVRCIADKLGLPVMTVQHIIERLCKIYKVCTNTCTTTQRGSVLTVCNIDSYKKVVCTNACTTQRKEKEKEKTEKQENPPAPLKEVKEKKEKEKEKKDKTTARTTFRKPTVDDVESYIREKGFNVNAQQFFDHYEMIGWVYGKDRKPIKDWKAAVRTWVRNESRFGSNSLWGGSQILRDNSSSKFENDVSWK